jgi:hypothetical protein
MLCDMTFDLQEDVGKSNKDKEMHPNKHPAVEGQDYTAFLCDYCLAIICKNCRVEYPSVSTPASFTFPTNEDANLPLSSNSK